MANNNNPFVVGGGTPDSTVNNTPYSTINTANNPAPENQTGSLSSSSQGMTQEEINDPNKIKVTVADYEAPIVVLFGPPACGKTMTLVRLARYLHSQGYSVVPDSSFRPQYDRRYREMCEDFNSLLNRSNAANSNSIIDFFLAKVRTSTGKTLCQILEAPGEHYYNPRNPNGNFPAYINAIINRSNRKIWMIILEPDESTGMDEVARKGYVSKIRKLKSSLNPQDKIIFLLNKVDLTPFVITPGNINYSQAIKHVEFMYPNIFVPFRNQNPVTKIWNPVNFDFQAFQTGVYNETQEGSQTFTEGNDIYPRKLWEIIRKRING